MLLLSVRRAGLYNCIYTKVGTLSLFICVYALTEVGSPMISRVNNDVTLRLTNSRCYIQVYTGIQTSVTSTQ